MMFTSGSICWSVKVIVCPDALSPLFCQAMVAARDRSSEAPPPTLAASALPSAGWLLFSQAGSERLTSVLPSPSKLSR